MGTLTSVCTLAEYSNFHCTFPLFASTRSKMYVSWFRTTFRKNNSVRISYAIIIIIIMTGSFFAWKTWTSLSSSNVHVPKVMQRQNVVFTSQRALNTYRGYRSTREASFIPCRSTWQTFKWHATEPFCTIMSQSQ